MSALMKVGSVFIYLPGKFQKSAQEKTVELFDQKCLIKLNEVATSLIKLAPYDGDTMSCPGLAAYITHVFPNTDWSQVTEGLLN